MLDSNSIAQMSLTQQAVFAQNAANTQQQPYYATFAGVPLQTPRMPGGVQMVPGPTGWGQPVLPHPIRTLAGAYFGMGNPQFNTMVQMEAYRQWFRPRIEHMAYWSMAAPVAAAQMGAAFSLWGPASRAFYRGITRFTGELVAPEAAAEGGLLRGLGNVLAALARPGMRGAALRGLAAGALESAAIYTLHPVMLATQFLMAAFRYGYHRYTMGRELSEFSREMGGLMPGFGTGVGMDLLDYFERLRWEGGPYATMRLRTEDIGTVFQTAARSGAFIGLRSVGDVRRRLREYTQVSIEAMRLLRTTIESAAQVVGQFVQMGASMNQIKKGLPMLIATGRAFGLTPEQTAQAAIQGAQTLGPFVGGPMAGARAGMQLQILPRIVGQAGGLALQQLGTQLLQQPQTAMIAGYAATPEQFAQMVRWGIPGIPTPEVIFRGQQRMAANPLFVLAGYLKAIPNETQRYWFVAQMLGYRPNEEEWRAINQLVNAYGDVQTQVLASGIQKRVEAAPKPTRWTPLASGLVEFGQALYSPIRWLGGRITDVFAGTGAGIYRWWTGNPVQEDVSGLDARQRAFAIGLMREIKTTDIKDLQAEADRYRRQLVGRYIGDAASYVRENPEAALTIVMLQEGKITRQEAFHRLVGIMGVDLTAIVFQLLEGGGRKRDALVNLAYASSRARGEALRREGKEVVATIMRMGGAPVAPGTLEKEYTLEEAKTYLRRAKVAPELAPLVTKMQKARSWEELYAVATEAAAPTEGQATVIPSEAAMKVLSNLVIEAARGSNIVIKGDKIRIEEER